MAGRPRLREFCEAIELLGGDHVVFDTLMEHGSLTKTAAALGVGNMMLHWWMKQLPEREKAFKDLREVIASHMLDEVLTLADEPPEINPMTGSVDSGWVSNQKNRIDTRKWLATRYDRQYSDRPPGEVSADAVNTLAELLATIKGVGSQRLVQAPADAIEGEVVSRVISQPLVP